MHAESGRIFKHVARWRSFFLLALTPPRLHIRHTLAYIIFFLRVVNVLVFSVPRFCASGFVFSNCRNHSETALNAFSWIRSMFLKKHSSKNINYFMSKNKIFEKIFLKKIWFFRKKSDIFQRTFQNSLWKIKNLLWKFLTFLKIFSNFSIFRTFFKKNFPEIYFFDMK